mmetsp:Transcript_37428/g.105646  ORF Transcript_37428/g.105646 Transcript_37428/m.105646 type:complete len:270 (-) Transcript_37428:44-853(-)
MVLDQAPIEILEAFAEVGMYADLEPPVVVELGGRALLVTFEGLVAHQLLASLEESDAEVASPSHTSEVPIADPSPLGGGIPNASIEVQVRAFPATSITFPCEGYLHLRARCEIDTLKVGMQGGWLLHWTPPNAAWHWLDQALAPGLIPAVDRRCVRVRRRLGLGGLTLHSLCIATHASLHLCFVGRSAGTWAPPILGGHSFVRLRLIWKRHASYCTATVSQLLLGCSGRAVPFSPLDTVGGCNLRAQSAVFFLSLQPVIYLSYFSWRAF